MKSDSIQDIYELSPLQQGILFHSLYAPESAVYFVQLCYSLKGNFNVVAFEQAWQEVVNRHTVLRTAFYWENLEKPLQVVHREVKVSLIQHDWRDINSNEEPQKLQEFLESDRTANFDLTQPCLMRLNLIRCNDDCYYFVWSKHHLILDGWSTALVLKEVVEIYQSIYQGKNLPLILDTSFGDYIGWLQQQDLNKAKEFWQQSLQGVTAPTPLINLNTQDSFKQPEKSNQQVIKLSQTTTAALQSLARQNQLTLNTLVQGAYALLLSRYSRETDVVYGVTVSGRPADLVKAESMVGMFINTLPVRVTIDAKESLLSWLRKLQSQLAQIRQYEYSPLVEVQGWSEIPRGLPLFESILVFENYPIDSALKNGMKDLEIQCISAVDNTNYSITVTVIPSSELELKISYDCDRFHSDTITRMLGHLLTLLENMIADVSQPLASLSILTAFEKHQLLVEWNNTQVDYPQNKCIHQLFEEQLEKTPDAIAVVFENLQLTYSELNKRANQLAHYLQHLGVKPETLVGMFIERSLEMVVGILAILKAGGAYLPLDPTYPKQRLAFMLEDARVSCLLVQSHLVDGLPPHQAQVININTVDREIAGYSKANPVSDVQLENAAYVIYTSGSTGTPKGVINIHKGLYNRLLWMQDTYQLKVCDRILQKTPFSFDVSVWEFFWPLFTGATLVLAKPGGHQDPSYLVQLIIQQQITTLHFVPSMLQVFLEEPGVEKSHTVKRVICSGEALPFELQKHFFERLDAELYNLYGPTEAAIDVTAWKCQKNSNQKIVPIGYPIANTQIYILDEYLQHVPVGIPGELHIGGVGLARGYLNRPELTNEKFISSPFEPEKRLYKTGDLARYLPDGTIEYLGRIDHQVKIRGFRIETGEIEAAIAQHPSIHQVVVLARKDAPSEQQLAAYVITHSKYSITTSELRSFLKNSLPNYMLPNTFVMLAELPLLPNGKVDRKALPAADTARPNLQTVFAASRTQAEEALVRIWSEVLRLENVGINDNFFELGGESILSLQVIAKANQAGLQLTLKQIFEYQTIADLALVAGITTKIATEQGIVKGSLPLTPIQHWFFEQEFLDSHHWNQAVMLEVDQTCDPILLEQVVNQLILHHDALRSRFEKTEFGWQSIIGEPENITPFYTIDLSTLPEHEQIHSIKIKANTLQASLNLFKAQLVQFALFVLGKDKPNRLLIIIHHLAVDGVSWRILLEDLQTAYQQLIYSEKIQLPVKTTSVKQWAEKLQEYAKLETIKLEINYWLNQPYQNIAPLPIDYLNGENSVASACTVSVSLTQEETESLLHEVPAAYQTQINDILLTALVQTFNQWTGNSSLLVNLEGHGREDILDNVDLSRTVGWFTTIFPVLLDITAAFDPGEALKTVKEKLRSIPRKGINYGALRYLSQKSIAEKLQALPQAEVIFNYLGQFDQVLSETSIFRPASESAGETQSPRASRDYLLEVNGLIVNDQLRLNWTYSKALHRKTTVEKLAQIYIEKLRSLIVHCQSPNAGSYTPSDFPQMQFNQQELDQFMAELG
jgi:amino acid adenylation domain-containing protein/non-ribosomal peptide synthase protein (TIGR01720 family)